MEAGSWDSVEKRVAMMSVNGHSFLFAFLLLCSQVAESAVRGAGTRVRSRNGTCKNVLISDWVRTAQNRSRSVCWLVVLSLRIGPSSQFFYDIEFCLNFHLKNHEYLKETMNATAFTRGALSRSSAFLNEYRTDFEWIDHDFKSPLNKLEKKRSEQ